MKKITLYLLLACPLFGFTQEKKADDTKSDIKGEFYVGLGYQVHDDFSLNNKLSQSNVEVLNTNRPEFVFGLNVFGKKFSTDIEVAFSQNEEKNQTTSIQDVNGTGRIKFHYNLINKDKVAFTTGLSFSGTSTEVDIYSTNNQINFNDLNPANNIGLITLRNTMFYVGPSTSLYLFKNKNYKLRFNVAYEFGFTRGKWKSDYASITNTVNESGNNRLMLGIVFQ